MALNYTMHYDTILVFQDQQNQIPICYDWNVEGEPRTSETRAFSQLLIECQTTYTRMGFRTGSSTECLHCDNFEKLFCSEWKVEGEPCTSGTRTFHTI